jgi:hypothetical protein
LAQPTRSRADLRLDVLKKIDPVSEPKLSTTTAIGSTTTLKDSLLAPAAESEDFVGDWIYIREFVTSGPIVGVIARVTAVDFSGTNSTLTLAPAITAVQTGTDYERHRKVRPNIINDRLDVILGLLRQNVLLPATIVDNGDFEASTTSTDSGSNTAEGLDATETEIDVDTSGANFDLGDVIQIDGEILGPITAIDQSGTDIVVARGIMGTTAAAHDTSADINILTPGDWTAAGTGGTPALAIADTHVRHGRASLVVTNDGSTTVGYAKSASMNLPGGTAIIVSADVFITAGDSARLTVIDVTNSNATIGTAMKSDETGWVHLEGLFTVPITCEQVQVWAESQAVSDVTYWDHITVWPTLDKGIDLPAFLDFLYDVESIFFYPVGIGIAGTDNVNAYRINEGVPQFYAHSQKELDDTGAGASRFYVPSRTPTNALWIKGRKPYNAFSGSTDAIKDIDTTQANRYVLVNMTAASIIDDLALDATEAEKETLARSLQSRALLLRFEINDILASMTPPKKKIVTTPFTRE